MGTHSPLDCPTGSLGHPAVGGWATALQGVRTLNPEPVAVLPYTAKGALPLGPGGAEMTLPRPVGPQQAQGSPSERPEGEGQREL